MVEGETQTDFEYRLGVIPVTNVDRGTNTKKTSDNTDKTLRQRKSQPKSPKRERGGKNPIIRIIMEN